MKTKHTPGPWKIGRDRTIRSNPTVCNGFFICDIAENPNIFADAKLIAAAPDLLHYLKCVAARLNIEAKEKKVFPCAAILPEINAAISKAEGD